MKNRISIPDTDLAFHPLGLGTVNAGLSWDGADADRIFDAFLDMGVCSGFFHKYAAGGIDAVKTSPYCTEGNLKMAERVKMLCEKYNATVTQAVLGFFGQQDFDCAPLYGPKNAEQIIEAMKTWDIPFKKEDYMAE